LTDQGGEGQGQLLGEFVEAGGEILWGEVVADYELTFDEPAPLARTVSTR
jgi:hypothetical protein